VKSRERALVFTDRPSKNETVGPEDLKRRQRLRDIALLVAETGRAFTSNILFYEYSATGGHAKEPPVKLWQFAFGKRAVAALKNKGLLASIIRKSATGAIIKEAEAVIYKYKKDAVHAVIALSNYSTSHTTFRNLLTKICGTRYASMPLFEAEMLEGAMAIDYRELKRRTTLIAGEVRKAELIEVKTPNGTHIAFSKKGRKVSADTGILTRPGSFGNLPAGEVYLAPLESTADGTLILEWAPTRKLSSSVVLTVKDGYVGEVLGDEPFASYLREKLRERKENGNIAELGIGTNDRARRPDNILESEKILGTVHIALGDNTSFGGKVSAPFHQDFVFFRPTVTLIDEDGKRTELMREGKFI